MGTNHGSLRDEHNDYVYYKAIKGFNELEKEKIINKYQYFDVSKEPNEHRVKFIVIPPLQNIS